MNANTTIDKNNMSKVFLNVNTLNCEVWIFTGAKIHLNGIGEMDDYMPPPTFLIEGLTVEMQVENYVNSFTTQLYKISQSAIGLDLNDMSQIFVNHNTPNIMGTKLYKKISETFQGAKLGTIQSIQFIGYK